MGVATKEQVANLIIGGRKLKANEYIVSVEKIANNNIKGTLDKLGISLAEAMERLAPSSSGRLQNSIDVIGVKEFGNGFRLEIGFGVDYHDYIDKGVLGVEDKTKRTFKNSKGVKYEFKNYGMPPEALKELEGWAKRKNIELQATQLKSKRKRKLKKVTSSASSLAYMIKRFGIEGRNYKAKALKEVMPDYKKQLEQVGYNALILKVTKQ
jgi:hypothetical protein